MIQKDTISQVQANSIFFSVHQYNGKVISHCSQLKLENGPCTFFPQIRYMKFIWKLSLNMRILGYFWKMSGKEETGLWVILDPTIQLSYLFCYKIVIFQQYEL